MPPVVNQFTPLDENRGEACQVSGRGDAYHVDVEEDTNVDDCSTSGSQEKSGQSVRARLVAVGGYFAQVALLVNLVVLTFLVYVNSSSSEQGSEARCSTHILEQVMMPLNVLLGLSSLCLPRCSESSWSRRSKRGLEHTIKVSDCDFVVPGSEREPSTILESSTMDRVEESCEDEDSPKYESGTITPVEDLMHELMQVALSLCSAAPTECRGLLANCSYEERQAVHLLGQMVRNHLFPEADGIEDQEQSSHENTKAPALSSGFSIATDGASRSEVSGEKVQRWNMLNDAVDTFLFGTSTGTDQVNAHNAGVKMPVMSAEMPALDVMPHSPSKTVDSDQKSGPTVTPPPVMTGSTASPTQDCMSAGSAAWSPRESASPAECGWNEENAETAASPFSVPEVSLTLAPTPAGPPGPTPQLHLPVKDDAEAQQLSQRGSTPPKTKQSNKKSADSRRSSVSSANSQFSATSFTDFNRRNSCRKSSTSSNERKKGASRRASGESHRGRGDKSRFSSNGSTRSGNQLSTRKDQSKFNSNVSSHPSEVVRGLLRTFAAEATEDIGGVSWGRDGCAAQCEEMESERLASINLANRYRDRNDSMDDRTSRRQSLEIDTSFEHQRARAYTVGYSANLEQELRDACQAVFPNSPRSPAASRNASRRGSVQGDGSRVLAQKYATCGALAIPEARSNAGSRRGSTLSVAMASDAGRPRKLSTVSKNSPQPESPKSLARRLSAVSNFSVRRSNSVAPSQFSHVSSAHTGSHEEEGTGSSQMAPSASLRSCSVSSHNGSTVSRKRGNGADAFRFTSVGKRFRESLKKITTRGDKSRRTTSTGAMSRLKKWGIPKAVQKLFVDYERRTQEIQYRQILGFKSVDELAGEVEAGLCRIVDGEQVTRVVQVCALRILANTGNAGVKGDLVLVQKWHRSRKGGCFRTNALPSTKLRGQEEPREAALRMLESEFGEFATCLEVNNDVPLEEFVQEKESTSYPGLLTRYITTIVEVRINPGTDFKVLADLGLGPECPEHLQGSVLADAESGETSYDWMQVKHCRAQGIHVAGMKDYTTLEVLREQEDKDSEDGGDLGPDPVELVRCLQEFATADDGLTLKDMVKIRGEILELTLQDITKGLCCHPHADAHMDDDANCHADPSRQHINANSFQTCPCSPSGSTMTDQTADARTSPAMSSVAGLNSQSALPQRGSLFQILSLMQGGRPSAGYDMPPDMEGLEERRRSWGEKSYALSENSVSTAMLWKMAMQDFDWDQPKNSGAGSQKGSPPPALETGSLKGSPPPALETGSLKGSPPPALDTLERAALLPRQSSPPEGVLGRCAGEVEQEQRVCTSQQDAAAAAPASAVEGASSCMQRSTTTGSNAETTMSTSAQGQLEESESQDERARKYAERKAKIKAKKSQPGKVSYGEILRNCYEQFPHSACAADHDKSGTCTIVDNGLAEALHPGPLAAAALAAAPALQEAAAPVAASSPRHGLERGAEMNSAVSLRVSEANAEDQEEKSRRYAERKARMKARKADARPGKVNYGEILRNSYEQFPKDPPLAAAQGRAGEANPDAQADAASNVSQQGGASVSGASPSSTDVEGGRTQMAEQEESMLHTQSAGSCDSASTADSAGTGSLGSPESPRLDTISCKSTPGDPFCLSQEGYWGVIRKVLAARGDQSQSPEPDEKPMTQEEKMKLWRARKEKRKSNEKLKKRPSYGSLLKKESSPVVSPRTSPTPSDEANDLPRPHGEMKINVVGASDACMGSTSLFGGRQSTGSGALGFQFSAGLVHANGRLSLPKTALEPIPSPPGSRRASELERDEEDDEMDGKRRSLVADSVSSPDSFGSDDVDKQQDGWEGDEQAAQDVSRAQQSPQLSGTQLASPRYSREHGSTDTLEQAMKGLGVFDE